MSATVGRDQYLAKYSSVDAIPNDLINNLISCTPIAPVFDSSPRQPESPQKRRIRFRVDSNAILDLHDSVITIHSII